MSLAGKDYVGSYRLVRPIQAGRTCAVWEAIKDDLNQRFALKMLQGEYRKDKEAVAMLKNEFAAGRAMQHTNTMRIYDYGVDREMPYLVMELFPGRNLKQEVREGVDRFAWRVQEIIQQAAEGLKFFHEQGWVHRDIKPDNLMMNDEGLVKLIDYSIAQKLKKGLGKIFSKKGKVQGTRSYMSPEQIRGENVDARADIYSFGCTIFELVSGKVPYTAVNPNDLLNKHLSAGIPSVVVVNENVTPEFALLISRTLAKRKEDRPQSMGDFLQLLSGVRLFKSRPKKPGEAN